MALTNAANGTTTPVVGTETTLSGASFTTAATYVCLIDTTNMVGGDTFEIRVYAKVLTGGSELQVYYASYANVQSNPVKATVPLPSLYSCHFSIKQTAGVARAFAWEIATL